MKPLIDLLQQIKSLLQQLLDRSVQTGKTVGTKLKPPKLYSWQSFILGSLGAGLVSFLAIGFLAVFLGLLGQVLLLIGLYWFGIEAAIFLTPWIIAALISAFAYFNLRTIDGIPETMPNLAIVAFPIIAAAIAVLPSLLNREQGDRAVKWKNALLVFGIHILVACWIQFYFVVQGWLREYPTFLAEDFSGSSFVVKVRFQQEPISSRGTALLDGIGNELKKQLNDQPWENLQPLSHDKLSARIETIKQAVGAGVASAAENQLWKIQKDITAEGSGYIIYLEALWEGPRSKLQRVDSAKLCQVTQGFSEANQFQEAVALVECQPARKVKSFLGGEG